MSAAPKPQGNDTADANKMLSDILVRSLMNQGVPVEEAVDEIRRVSNLPQFERGDHVDVAKHITSALAPDGPQPVFADGEMYRYEAGHGLWTVIPKDQIERRASQLAGAIAGKTRLRLKASDLSGIARVVSILASIPDFFANARSGLACTNGFALIEDGEVHLVPHDPAHRARVPVPFAYQPVVSWDDLLRKAPKFASFLVSVFPTADDGSSKIECMRQFVGASLTGTATRFQVCLFLYGDGANGKSTLLKVIESIFPRSSVVAIPPHEFGQEYRRAMLAGKLLNSVNETPEADILSGESFKAIVAGDTITGRPIRQSPIQFRPTAGHVFSCNRLPGSNDMTPGFWRRIIVLHFTRRFTPEEQVPDLANQIIAEELPAVASWFLGGAADALRNGRYAIPASSKVAVDEWRKESDQVALYIEDKLEAEPEARDHMLGSVLYADYRQWALDTGHRPLSIQRFAGRMRILGFGGGGR